jgi:hypothetical protein
MKTRTAPWDYNRKPSRKSMTNICCGCGEESILCFDNEQCKNCGCDSIALVLWDELESIQEIIQSANDNIDLAQHAPAEDEYTAAAHDAWDLHEMGMGR